jgi:predicted ArsR family transcriptional regulator
MDELEAVGDPELRAALLFARGAARPVTADELAAFQHVHRNVARTRLERLAAAGLLAADFERRSGRTGPGAGRPAKTYAVEPALEAIEFPKRRYESLLGLLLETLPAGDRPRRLHDVGVAFGAELADAAGLRRAPTPPQAFERLAAAVRSLGYQASIESIDVSTAVLSTPTCPLRPLVRMHAEAAAIDRGMWAGLASRALGGGEAEAAHCETHDCLLDRASCRVSITLRAGRSL